MKSIAKLTPENLLSAKQIFFNKDWNISEEDVFEDVSYEIFCSMLNFFPIDKQKLLLDLTSQFIKFPTGMYLNGYSDVFENMELPKEIDSFYILPLVTEEDLKKQKSGGYVLYLLSKRKSQLERLFPWQFNFISERIDTSPRDLPSPTIFNNQKNTRIILIDDFIGTGETVEKAIKYHSGKLLYKVENIIVLTLIAQADGINYLRERGISVYAHKICKKGISDYYSGITKSNMIKHMEEIEEFLNVEKKFQFGWGRSEALVRLHDTPDNTFPVYWYDSILANGEIYNALFTRNP